MWRWHSRLFPSPTSPLTSVVRTNVVIHFLWVCLLEDFHQILALRCQWTWKINACRHPAQFNKIYLAYDMTGLLNIRIMLVSVSHGAGSLVSQLGSTISRHEWALSKVGTHTDMYDLRCYLDINPNNRAWAALASHCAAYSEGKI